MATVSNRFEKHGAWVWTTVWAVSLIAALALCEWLLAPGTGRHRMDGFGTGPGPARGLVMREWKPNTDFRFVPVPERKLYPQAGLREIYEIATDEEGFVKPSRVHARPDVSVVFLGGSTTECMFVAPENRFPYVVARKLEGELGLKINGINSGLSGNNSMHSMLLLLGKVLPLRPDFVVVMHNANDLGILSRKEGYWLGGRDSRRIVRSEQVSASEAGGLFLRAVIPYTTQTLLRGWSTLRGMLGIGPARAQHAGADSAPDRAVAMARDFESSLRSLVRVVAAWGITPVLMTQVLVRSQSDKESKHNFLTREDLTGVVHRPQDFATTHDHFNAIIRLVAHTEGAVLIDLATARQWVFGDVYDGLHFTDQGSRLVADIVATALKDEIVRKRNAKSER